MEDGDNISVEIDGSALFESEIQEMDLDIDEFYSVSSDETSSFVDETDGPGPQQQVYILSTRAHYERNGRKGRSFMSAAIGLIADHERNPEASIPDRKRQRHYKPRLDDTRSEVHRRCHQVFLHPPHRCLRDVANTTREGMVTWLVDNPIDDEQDFEYIREEMNRFRNGTHRDDEPTLTKSMKFFQEKKYKKNILMCISLGLNGCDFQNDEPFTGFTQHAQERLFYPETRHLLEEVTRRYYVLRYHEQYIRVDPPSPSEWGRDRALQWLRMNPLLDPADVQFFQAFVMYYKEHLRSLPRLLAEFRVSRQFHEEMLETARQQLERVQATKATNATMTAQEFIRQGVEWHETKLSDIRLYIGHIQSLGLL